MKSRPAAFLSYTHFDDNQSKGYLTKFRILLSGEVSAQTGTKFEIFQDKEHIEWGENWRERIDNAMNEATFLIPVITPSFFRSRQCRKEVDQFLKREKELGRNDLILPVYFTGEVLRDNTSGVGKESLEQIIASHQYVDWREIKHKPVRSPVVRRAIERLAIQIKNALGEVEKEPQRQIRAAGGRSKRPGVADIYIGHLPGTGAKLFGREPELEILDKAWADRKSNRKTNIISFVAFGGIGKSALVNHWLERMRRKDYCGAERVFAESFYRQGTSDQATSPDSFIVSALKQFGDSMPDEGNPEEKGARLAKLICKHRTLLILDGLEPMQYTTGEKKGRLTHPGIRRLLLDLANQNQGLCVISSRLHATDLNRFVGSSVREAPLKPLTRVAGRELLESQRVHGSVEEMEKGADEFGGHALALSILGDFLKKAAGGDIRQRDRIGPLNHHPEKGGHARRVMESYAKWFKGRKSYQVEFESLRLMGLFDRPVEPGAWRVLIKKPVIRGLTDKISNATEMRRRYALGVLREAHLLESESDRSPLEQRRIKSDPDVIDCHPLIREHFADDLLRKNPAGWKQAHRRLFEFFSSKTEKAPETVEEMAPCYQAITHACLAGRHRQAFEEVYVPYVRRRGAYNTEVLRAFADDYAALKCFLQRDRFEVVKELRNRSSFIFGEIGFDLRALGRLDEATEAMRSALEWDKAESRRDARHRVNAARQADLLSTTHLIRGSVQDAINVAREAVEIAGNDAYHRMICLTTLADAKHHAGDLNGAMRDFEKAELISRKIFAKQKWSYLRSFQGYRYCDYFLTIGRPKQVLQRVRRTMIWDQEGGYPTPSVSNFSVKEEPILLHALQTEGKVLPLVLDHLMYSRVLLALNTPNEDTFREAEHHLNDALDGILKSATQHLRPKVLLAKAELQRAKQDIKGAEETLTECIEISERSEMGLYEADCYFALGRLYLEESAKARKRESRGMAEIERAQTLSDRLGYGLLKRKISTLLG